MDIAIYILLGCIIFYFGHSINVKRKEYISFKKMALFFFNNRNNNKDLMNDIEEFGKKEKFSFILNVCTDLIFGVCICVVLIVMWITLKKYI